MQALGIGKIVRNINFEKAQGYTLPPIHHAPHRALAGKRLNYFLGAIMHAMSGKPQSLFTLLVKTTVYEWVQVEYFALLFCFLLKKVRSSTNSPPLCCLSALLPLSSTVRRG